MRAVVDVHLRLVGAEVELLVAGVVEVVQVVLCHADSGVAQVVAVDLRG